MKKTKFIGFRVTEAEYNKIKKKAEKSKLSISDYEKTLYPDMNKYLKSVLIPKMLIKLWQGVGRLIRSETDTGVISILDVRACETGSYHQDVLHALPECRSVESIEDTRAFLNDKKAKKLFWIWSQKK